MLREKFSASRGIKVVFQAEGTKTLQYNPAMEQKKTHLHRECSIPLLAFYRWTRKRLEYRR